MRLKRQQLLISLISVSLFVIIFFLGYFLPTKVYAKDTCKDTSEPKYTCRADDYNCLVKAPTCYTYPENKPITSPPNNICHCDSGIYECKDSLDIQGNSSIFTRIWNCGSSKITVSLTADQDCVIVSDFTSLKGYTTIHWKAQPADQVSRCTGLDQSGDLPSSGYMRVEVHTDFNGRLHYNLFIITCYDKDNIPRTASVSIAASTANCTDINATNLYTSTPDIPVNVSPVSLSTDSTDESCYDKDHAIWELLFRGIDILVSVIFWLLAWLFRWVLKAFIIPVFLWILNPNSWGGMAGGNPIVSGLWSSVKDIANIGLLLAVVVIAIATIFRVKKYEVKSTILILIAVALLINFSLTLCGIAIDFSNYLTLYFLNSGQTGNLANNIAATLDQIACATQHFPAKDFPHTISAVVILILSIILIGQFIGLAAYTAVRVVTLWITTILSPLAMVTAILPATKQVWKTWLNYFLTYIFGLPAIAFSLWFVLSISYDAASHINALSKTGDFQEDGFIAVLAYAIVWIILFQIPLIVANFLNAGTMNKAYDWTTKKIRGWLIGGAALAGGAIAKKAITSRTATGAAERLKKISPTLGLAFEKKIKEIRDKEIKKRGESLAATNDYKLLSGMLKDPRYRNPEARLAILSRLAEIDHGKHLTTDPQIYKNYLSLREKYKDTGEIKNIEKLMPSWKEIPQDYLQLVPAKQNEHLQTFVKKLLDIAKSKDQAKEVNWLATFEDARLRGFLGHLAPELISNLSVGQFINIINAISPDKRFIFIKDYMLMPYRQAGKDLQAENPALHKWLKTGTLGGAPLMQQEIADLSSKGLI